MDGPARTPSRSDGSAVTDSSNRSRPETEPRAPLRDASGNTCEVCGNQYDKSFQVVMRGESHTFDSFECAVHRLAPECSHCGCRILGHGIEASGTFYCCANCARQAGVDGSQDRAS